MKEKGFRSILMADDDEDDCLLAGSAFQEAGLSDKLRLVADGQELMEYLYRQGSFSDPEQFPSPDLILLDLNMPRKERSRGAAGDKDPWPPEVHSHHHPLDFERSGRH